jgi:hypothetical protein
MRLAAAGGGERHGVRPSIGQREQGRVREWPLGNGLNGAETLAALAKKKSVLAVAALQARSAPPVAYMRDLIKEGYVARAWIENADNDATNALRAGRVGPRARAWIEPKRGGVRELGASLSRAWIETRLPRQRSSSVTGSCAWIETFRACRLLG